MTVDPALVTLANFTVTPFNVTETFCPDGVVTPVAEKVANWVIGPFIVTLTGFVLPVNDPDPVPVQPLNVKPLLGVAVICTVCPLLKNDPLAGCTLPPVPVFIVS